MFIIASTAGATQQSIMLHRFASHPDHLRRLRALLGRGDCPRPVKIFVWQIPVVMLRFRIYLLLNALFSYLWHAAFRDGKRHCEELKVNVPITALPDAASDIPRDFPDCCHVHHHCCFYWLLSHPVRCCWVLKHQIKRRKV